MSPRYAGYGITMNVPSFNPGTVTPNTGSGGGVTGPTATFMWDPTLMFGPQPPAPATDTPPGGYAPPTGAPPGGYAPPTPPSTPFDSGGIATTTFILNPDFSYKPQFDVASPFTGGAPARDGGDATRTSAPASPDGTNTGLTQPTYQTTAQLPGQQAQYYTGGAKLPPPPTPPGGGAGAGAGGCSMPTSPQCPTGQLPLPNGSCIEPYTACKSQGKIYNPCVKADGCSPLAAGGGTTGGTATSGTTMAIAGAAALAALFLLR
jgi:hypothetical protein